jgi:hypothetical protein
MGMGFSSCTQRAIRFDLHVLIGAMRADHAFGIGCDAVCFARKSHMLPGMNGIQRIQLAILIGPTSMRRATNTK